MDKIFFEAVSKVASDSLETIRQLSALHDTNIEKLPKTTRSKDNLRAVFDYIEQYPIIDIKRTARDYLCYFFDWCDMIGTDKIIFIKLNYNTV